MWYCRLPHTCNVRVLNMCGRRGVAATIARGDADAELDTSPRSRLAARRAASAARGVHGEARTQAQAHNVWPQEEDRGEAPPPRVLPRVSHPSPSYRRQKWCSVVDLTSGAL